MSASTLPSRFLPKGPIRPGSVATRLRERPSARFTPYGASTAAAHIGREGGGRD